MPGGAVREGEKTLHFGYVKFNMPIRYPSEDVEQKGL